MAEEQSYTIPWDTIYVVEEERLLRNQGRVRDVDVLDDGSIVFLTDFENGSIMHVTAKD